MLGSCVSKFQFKFEKFKFTFEFVGAGAGTHVPLSGPELGTRVPVPPYRVRIRIDQLSRKGSKSHFSQKRK